MSDASGPTYASLTPANPTIINGLAGVDLQTGQQLTTHQGVMNHSDQAVVNSVNVVNTVGVAGTGAVQTVASPIMATVIPPNSGSPAQANGNATATAGESSVSLDRNSLVAVLNFLKKNQFKATEDLLRQETNFYDTVSDSEGGIGGDSEVTSVLSAYKSEGDPAEYEDAYKSLQNFIEKSLDAYKHEVALVLFPVFVHMYLELVYNGHEEVAKSFMEKFGNTQEDYFEEDMHKLSLVTSRDHMTGYQIMDNFRSNQLGRYRGERFLLISILLHAALGVKMISSNFQLYPVISFSKPPGQPANQSTVSTCGRPAQQTTAATVSYSNNIQSHTSCHFSKQTVSPMYSDSSA
ncbi:uncharacterized protein LOC134767365 [Penaeus indicus]|uniref:uncharacterized protein LOC134767365 n=1 Tax=Penaeus indicus TaxID=29960 RepID=UPI00300D7483